MKMDTPHIVPLSKQALAMFAELKFLAGDSPYVFPSRNDHRHPISKTTLNCVVRTLDLNVRYFVIHSFRRTASILRADMPGDARHSEYDRNASTAEHPRYAGPLFLKTPRGIGAHLSRGATPFGIIRAQR